MITGILVALPEELHTLTKFNIQQGQCFAVAENTLITLSGSGAKNAKNATQNLISQGVAQLISWGCAGALAPHLKAGDLVIPEHVLTKDGIKLATHKAWSQHVIKLLDNAISYHQSCLLESATTIRLTQNKNRQYQLTQAIAVDMESAIVAQLAHQAQIPFIAIRSIVDPNQFDLPHAINDAMTDKGMVSIRKLIMYLGSHPGDLPCLIKLGLYFRAASKTLKYLARRLPQITQSQWRQA